MVSLTASGQRRKVRPFGAIVERGFHAIGWFRTCPRSARISGLKGSSWEVAVAASTTVVPRSETLVACSAPEASRELADGHALAEVQAPQLCPLFHENSSWRSRRIGLLWLALG